MPRFTDDIGASVIHGTLTPPDGGDIRFACDYLPVNGGWLMKCRRLDAIAPVIERWQAERPLILSLTDFVPHRKAAG